MAQDPMRDAGSGMCRCRETSASGGSRGEHSRAEQSRAAGWPWWTGLSSAVQMDGSWSSECRVHGAWCMGRQVVTKLSSLPGKRKSWRLLACEMPRPIRCPGQSTLCPTLDVKPLLPHVHLRNNTTNTTPRRGQWRTPSPVLYKNARGWVSGSFENFLLRATTRRSPSYPPERDHYSNVCMDK
ncbi:hypothetical protein DM02DRAFT_434563 [Periconia macrospinosa]|uniref:Uncharacterized protein n=1 Tax=Periconia macrospinosa TaxID=97972 RepID=A0A2V1DMG8_9PLEO|nr:hypothetical protein DM02DRAFT_434563 [Periconia macrospinosa]